MKLAELQRPYDWAGCVSLYIETGHPIAVIAEYFGIDAPGRLYKQTSNDVWRSQISSDN